jgi:ornithine--oxo-acid transaminase
MKTLDLVFKLCWVNDLLFLSLDVVVLGKALGGGFLPISCVLSDKEHMVFQPGIFFTRFIFIPDELGTHGSTYGGNSLASAVAIESLEVCASVYYFPSYS